MLAEPKSRKLKWSSDPQNVAWANDKNKFGLKMMRRMGWEEGESLGRYGTGIKKHIEFKPVLENRGLGYEASPCLESQHQPDFEEILQSLNKRYSTTENKKNLTNQDYFPIERGAAKSRPLRYKKFVQAKDLSRKSKQELSCIFIKQNNSKEMQTSLTEDSSISEFNKLDANAHFVRKTDSLIVVGSEQNSLESTERDLTLKPTYVALDDPMHSLDPICSEGIEQISCSKLQEKTRFKCRNKHSN